MRAQDLLTHAHSSGTSGQRPLMAPGGVSAAMGAASAAAINEEELFVLPFWSGRFLREARLNSCFPAVIEAAKHVARDKVCAPEMCILQACYAAIEADSCSQLHAPFKASSPLE